MRKWRAGAALMVLVLAASLARHVIASAQGTAQLQPIAVTWISDSGAPIPVDGIVCDNLHNTPGEQQDHLDLRLPIDLADQQASGTASNPDGTTSDSRKQPNAG